MIIVPSLCANHLSRNKCYKMLLPRIGDEPAKNRTDGIVKSIEFNANITIWIKIKNDEGSGKNEPQ